MSITYYWEVTGVNNTQQPASHQNFIDPSSSCPSCQTPLAFSPDASGPWQIWLRLSQLVATVSDRGRDPAELFDVLKVQYRLGEERAEAASVIIRAPQKPEVQVCPVEACDIDHDAVRGSLYHHIAHHADTCGGSNSMSVVSGFKVIDCKTKAIVSLPDNSQYAALSHVWGPPKAANGDWSFPQTIEDSRAVPLGLRFRYL